MDAATREFFSREKHLRRRDDTREVWVSEILKFYTGDFVSSGKPQDLTEYINRYVQQPIPPAYRVRFIPYDWTINQRPLPGDPQGLKPDGPGAELSAARRMAKSAAVTVPLPFKSAAAAVALVPALWLSTDRRTA